MKREDQEQADAPYNTEEGYTFPGAKIFQEERKENQGY